MGFTLLVSLDGPSDEFLGYTQAQWEAVFRAMGQALFYGSPGGPSFTPLLFPQGLQTPGHTPITQLWNITSPSESSRRSKPNSSARSDDDDDDDSEE